MENQSKTKPEKEKHIRIGSNAPSKSGIALASRCHKQPLTGHHVLAINLRWEHSLTLLLGKYKRRRDLSASDSLKHTFQTAPPLLSLSIRPSAICPSKLSNLSSHFVPNRSSIKNRFFFVFIFFRLVAEKP